jgi:hypothetical protein
MVGLPQREDDPEHDGPHSMFEEAPIVSMASLILKLFFGWPLYITINSTGPLAKRHEKNLSHFNPKTSIYEPKHFWDIIVSDVGVISMIGLLIYIARLTSTLDVIRYYVIPYSWVNFWLVLITYLQVIFSFWAFLGFLSHVCKDLTLIVLDSIPIPHSHTTLPKFGTSNVVLPLPSIVHMALALTTSNITLLIHM